MREDDETGKPGPHDPTRLLALSDGVFAVIMTLMVLELRVPATSAHLREGLRDEIPVFAVFVMSFLLAAVYWIGHRDLFKLIERTNTTLVWLNVVFLMVVSLIPFGAGLLGRYPLEAIAVALYGALLTALAGIRLIMYRYVTGHSELLTTQVAPARRSAVTQIMSSALAVYPVSIVVAQFAPVVVCAMFGITPVLFVTAIARANKPRKPARP